MSDLTLLDFFAVHADQPGVSEISSEAGYRTDGYLVFFNEDHEGIPFNRWWNALPLQDRYDLYAKTRYGLATAMEKERLNHV